MVLIYGRCTVYFALAGLLTLLLHLSQGGTLFRGFPSLPALCYVVGQSSDKAVDYALQPVTL